MIFRRTLIASVVMLAAGMALPTSGWAQSKALVKIVKNQQVQPARISARTLSNASPLTSSVYVTVGAGATPTIMMKKGIFQATTMVQAGPFPSPTPGGLLQITRTASAINEAFTLSPNWAQAATTAKTFMTPGPATPSGAWISPANGPSVMGSTFMASQQPVTNFCFTRNPPTAAPSGFPGQCVAAQRTGTLSRVPGAKKFGGAARLLRSDIQAVLFSGVVGLIDVNGKIESAMPPILGSTSLMRTPQWRLGPSAPGKVGNLNTQLYEYLPGGTTVANGNQLTVNPWTTGMASVHGPGYFGTSFAQTGSHNFNPTNLTGMISLVQPFLFEGFSRSGNAFLGQQIPGSTGGVFKHQMTFLPEPGTLALLGFGALGLAGLGRLRTRRD